MFFNTVSLRKKLLKKIELIKFFPLSKNCYCALFNYEFISIHTKRRMKTTDKVNTKTSSTHKKLGDRSMFEYVWTLKETKESLKSYQTDRIDSKPTQIIVTSA